MVSFAVGMVSSALLVAALIFLRPHSDAAIYHVNARNFTNSKIFGHVHISKTAGTTLNGELAARFERVCGHKGYSYDAFQANLREKSRSNGTKDDENDFISLVNPGFNRLRVPPEVMDEIGYEGCDYVSNEIDWHFWPDTFQNWDVPMELHIPCRDPVSHLMSMCNYKNQKFNCSSQDIFREIDRCIMDMDRFSAKLIDSYTNIRAKCFDSKSVEKYLDYMSGHLQRKRKEADYIYRATNKPRDRESECLWKDNVVLEKAKKYLLSKYEYYQYCSSCIGSKHDMLSSS